MAIVDFHGLVVPISPPHGTGGLNYTAFTMNAVGDKIAMVFRCPKAGTLHSFEYRTGAVANNPDNGLRLSFQTIDLATGFPDGTQSQFRDMTGTINANAWQTPAGPLTSDGTDTGTKRTVAAGELIGCVVDFVNFTASDSVVVNAINGVGNGVRANVYVADASDTTYSANAQNWPVVALKYDDGTYAMLNGYILPASGINARTFNSGTTPDERALRFTVPRRMRVCGAWVLTILGTGDTLVRLYDADNNVLASNTFDTNQTSSPSNNLYYEATLAPTELEPDEVYRLSFIPQSVNNVVVYDIDVPSAAHMAAVPGGAEWYSSTRTDAGAWTDSVTNRLWAGLIFDGL